MKFTKEISDKINDAWQYNSASTCIWATNEMDYFVTAIMRGEHIEIEEDNLVINNLVEFIQWKNKKWIFSQISILDKMPNEKKIELINQLISDSRINKIKFNETNPTHHYFSLTLINDTGRFQVYLGTTNDIDLIPAYKIDVEQIKFDKAIFKCVFSNGVSREYKYEIFEIK
jgi:hypothetical protein